MELSFRLLLGDCRAALAKLSAESVQCAVTSPPYWGLRDYGHEGQLGLERTPEEYVARMVDVFRDVRRVLRPDGVLWLNLGDSYCNTDKWGGGGANTGKQTVAEDGSVPSWAADRQRRPAIPGLKPKDLVGVPWRVAFALQADGWWLRSDCIWAKPNPMPESVTDRPTKAHEYVFLLTRSESYFYDAAAVAEPATYAGATTSGSLTVQDTAGEKLIAQNAHRGKPYAVVAETRNRRTVWTVATQPFPEAHFATFPEELVRPCILAGSKPGDTVLDPFNGAGTTGVVALKQGRHYIGCELNPEYVEMSRKRLRNVAPLFATEAA